MIGRKVIALLVAIGMLGVVGVGYAAYTSTVTGQVNTSSGTLTLMWQTAASTGFTPANATYMTCTAQIANGIAYFNATNMATYDTCSFEASVFNAGTLPAQWITICYQTTSLNLQNGGNAYWNDTFNGLPTPSIVGNGCGVISGASLAAGDSAIYAATLTMGMGQGSSWSFAVTLTGHVGV